MHWCCFLFCLLDPSCLDAQLAGAAGPARAQARRVGMLGGYACHLGTRNQEKKPLICGVPSFDTHTRTHVAGVYSRETQDRCCLGPDSTRYLNTQRRLIQCVNEALNMVATSRSTNPKCPAQVFLVYGISSWPGRASTSSHEGSERDPIDKPPGAEGCSGKTKASGRMCQTAIPSAKQPWSHGLVIALRGPEVAFAPEQTRGSSKASPFHRRAASDLHTTYISDLAQDAAACGTAWGQRRS